MNEAIFKDKAVKIMLRDGKEYTILPLTLNQMMDVWPLIVDIQKAAEKTTGMDKAIFATMRKLVAAVLKASNYKVEDKAAGDLVDLADITKLISLVVGQNPTILDVAAEKK